MGWAIFLLFPIIFSPGPPLGGGQVLKPFLQREYAGYVLLIGYFYLNMYVLLPKFYFKKRYATLILLTLAVFVLATLLPTWLVPSQLIENRPMGPPPPQQEGSVLFEFSHTFFHFAVVAFVSLALAISNRWKKAEQEKLNAELSYLKAQINPHFLFNTLNSIYSLAIQKSDLTAPAVVKLSAMMRYVVSETHRDFVSLEKEITYIRHYIELQQLRFGASIQILFSVEGPAAGRQIAPLVLIPFVENAFKHGVNAEENSCIRIDIHTDEKMLRLEVLNKKVFVQHSGEPKSGLGIENTRNRLQLLYPGRHTLQIVDTESDFKVSLTLRLV